MALTVTEILPPIRERLQLTASSDEETALKRMLDEVVADIYAAKDWSWRRFFGQVYSQAPYTTGTVAVTAGSTAVVGTSTVWTGVTGYDSAEDPFFIELNDTMHRVDSITDNTNLVLKAAPEDTVSGDACALYRAWIELDTSIDVLERVMVQDYGEIEILSPGALDAAFQFFNTSDSPSKAAMVMNTSSKGRRLCIYPYQDEDRLISYWGWRTPPTPGADSIGADDTTDCLFPDNYMQLVLHGLQAKWYDEWDDRPEKSMGFYQKFMRGIAEKWADDQRYQQVIARAGWLRWAASVSPDGLLDTGDPWGPRR